MSHATYLDYISQFFSSPDEFEAFSQAINTPLPKAFTCVHSRNNPKDTIQSLEAQWFPTEVSDYNSNNYIIKKRVTENWKLEIPLGKTPEHLLGYMYIQESAASLPASILPLPINGLILDMCAAPGGKTVQLADRCKISWNNNLVWANDPDSKRLIALASNLTRTGMENVVMTNYDGTQIGNLLPEHFDSILLDAPCSGEGTGFKSDFGTKYWDIRKVQSIARVQQQLLQSAYKACKFGWYILYSTCTTNPLENEMNVQRLMEKYPWGLEIQAIPISWLSTGINHELWTIDHKLLCRLWPHIHHTGGFFMCLIKKVNNPQTMLEETKQTPRYHNKDTKKQWITPPKFILADQSEVRNWLYEHFEITVPDNSIFVSSKDKIYITLNLIAEDLREYMRDKPGLQIIKWQKASDRRLLHGAWLIFDFGEKHQFELDDNQIMQHINQQDIDVTSYQLPVTNGNEQETGNRKQETEKKGYVQLLRKGNKVWVGKIIWNTIKNKFTWVV